MAGKLARRAKVGLLAFALLTKDATQLLADEIGDRLKEWSSLPQGSSGLVFTIDADISSFELASPSKGPLSKWKWKLGAPFVLQYRLAPGRYEIRLAPPLYAVTVDAKEGDLTYVNLGRFLAPSSSGSEPVARIQVTVSSGAIPSVVSERLEKAYQDGFKAVYTPEPLPSVADRVLLVSTEPPWWIPPPPPPKTPTQPTPPVNR
jgi:hypothetical protein